MTLGEPGQRIDLKNNFVNGAEIDVKISVNNNASLYFDLMMQRETDVTYGRFDAKATTPLGKNTLLELNVNMETSLPGG
jgi:hypothetical protein